MENRPGSRQNIGFFQLPKDLQLAGCSAAAVDRHGNYYLLHRGERPVICCDKNGQYLRSWGDGIIQGPHGLRVDPQGNLWITDVVQHVVFKFSPTG